VTTKFVLATANPDKAAEIHAVLEAVDLDIELRPRPASVPEVDETGATLEDNARLKARALAAATGLAAIADDTGLEVHALDGAPGVYAARYSGEDATYASNRAKLLAELDRVGATAPSQRGARFVTVALAAWPDGTELIARGEVAGVIVDEPRGDNGFGYDALFAPADGGGRTFAEMGASEKDACSHRGRAVRALAVLIAQHLGDPGQQS